MGVGDPLEAGYRLSGSIPAGAWHLVGDGVVLEAADLRFDVLWREGGPSGAEHTLVTFRHHFDPPPEGDGRWNAVPYEAEGEGLAAATGAADLLFLRFSVESSHPVGSRQYLPNGDGKLLGGRIPSIRLPK